MRRASRSSLARDAHEERRGLDGRSDRSLGSGSDGSDTGNDVDDLAAALLAELDRTGRQREQGVVATTADVDAGVEVGAALADDDLAGLDDLTAEALDAEVLRVRVATVAGGRCALFVCHVYES